MGTGITSWVPKLVRHSRSNKRSMAETITREAKRESQRKAKRFITCITKKKGENYSLSWKETISPTAPLMSLTCKQ
jgi:hypothetical protein